MILRSSIKKNLLQFHLKKGYKYAIFGCMSLLFSAIFIKKQELQWVGFPIILGALILITLGLYSYQKLKKLEITPHEITLLDEKHFLFSWKRKPWFILPFNVISECVYLEVDETYGIGIKLKDFTKFQLCNECFNLDTYTKNCQLKYNVDLFLPYFSKYAFDDFINYSECYVKA